jgi:hypothetical protein
MINKKDQKILKLLSEAKEWTVEEDIPRTSCEYLRMMYHRGLIDGAGRRDPRGTGNFKYSRLWKIKPAGAEALAESLK